MQCGGMSLSLPAMLLWVIISVLAAVGNAGVPMGCFFLTVSLMTGIGAPVEVMGAHTPNLHNCGYGGDSRKRMVRLLRLCDDQPRFAVTECNATLRPGYEKDLKVTSERPKSNVLL